MTPSTIDKIVEICRVDLAIACSPADRNLELISQLGFDSVTFAIGRVAFQEKLSVDIFDMDLMACHTLGDLVDLVDDLLRRKCIDQTTRVEG